MKKLENFKSNLENGILASNKVFIVSHIHPDCDSIASAICLYKIVQGLGKQPFIVLENNLDYVERTTKVIIDEVKDDINIVHASEIDSYVDDDSILIITDTNKKSLIPIDNYSRYKGIFIIDHHNTDVDTVYSDDSYINMNNSSASEIAYLLSKMFYTFDMSINSNYKLNIATYLLCGVYLDTSFIFRKLSRNTQECIASLIMSGGDLKYAVDLFGVSFEESMLIQNIINQTKWLKEGIGISYDIKDPNHVYKCEQLAIASDHLLRYRATEMAIIYGFCGNGIVHVSGRSKGKYDVGSIMRQLGGGGNESSGAAKVNTSDLEGIYAYLDMILRENNYGYNYDKSKSYIKK